MTSHIFDLPSKSWGKKHTSRGDLKKGIEASDSKIEFSGQVNYKRKSENKPDSDSASNFDDLD